MSNTIPIEQLSSAIASDVHSAVEGEVKAYCEKVLRNHVMKSVYSGGGTVYYARTYQFVNAVEVMDIKKSSTSVSFSIRINASKMGVSPATGGNPRMFGSHMGFSGQDQRPGLDEVLNDGITSSVMPSRPAFKFYESTTDELDSNLAGILVQGLRARGWDATVT